MRGSRDPALIRKMVEASRAVTMRPLEVRFWEKVRKDPNGCWTWTGALRHGHGTIHTKPPKSVDYTHRVVFSLLGREIPPGMEVDHVCRNRACCNPDHLRFVTKSVNSTENNLNPWAVNKRKTHCKRGHPFDEANTRWVTIRGHKCRNCIACDKLRPSYLAKLKARAEGNVKDNGSKS